MKEEVKKLNELFREYNEVQKEIKEKKKKFEEENKDLFEKYDLLKNKLEYMKEIINEKMINLYKEQGVKKTDYGVNIKVMKVLNYDESKALDWARTHNLCLKLDKKEFDKIAKTQQIEFVELKETPKVTYSESLKKGEVRL